MNTHIGYPPPQHLPAPSSVDLQDQLERAKLRLNQLEDDVADQAETLESERCDKLLAQREVTAARHVIAQLQAENADLRCRLTESHANTYRAVRLVAAARPVR